MNCIYNNPKIAIFGALLYYERTQIKNQMVQFTFFTYNAEHNNFDRILQFAENRYFSIFKIRFEGRKMTPIFF